jgi:hypothetical protein
VRRQPPRRGTGTAAILAAAALVGAFLGVVVVREGGGRRPAPWQVVRLAAVRYRAQTPVPVAAAGLSGAMVGILSGGRLGLFAPAGEASAPPLGLVGTERLGGGARPLALVAAGHAGRPVIAGVAAVGRRLVPFVLVLRSARRPASGVTWAPASLGTPIAAAPARLTGIAAAGRALAVAVSDARGGRLLLYGIGHGPPRLAATRRFSVAPSLLGGFDAHGTDLLLARFGPAAGRGAATQLALLSVPALRPERRLPWPRGGSAGLCGGGPSGVQVVTVGSGRIETWPVRARAGTVGPDRSGPTWASRVVASDPGPILLGRYAGVASVQTPGTEAPTPLPAGAGVGDTQVTEDDYGFVYVTWPGGAGLYVAGLRDPFGVVSAGVPGPLEAATGAGPWPRLWTGAGAELAPGPRGYGAAEPFSLAAVPALGGGGVAPRTAGLTAGLSLAGRPARWQLWLVRWARTAQALAQVRLPRRASAGLPVVRPEAGGVQVQVVVRSAGRALCEALAPARGVLVPTGAWACPAGAAAWVAVGPASAPRQVALTPGRGDLALCLRTGPDCRSAGRRRVAGRAPAQWLEVPVAGAWVAVGVGDGDPLALGLRHGRLALVRLRAPWRFGQVAVWRGEVVDATGDTVTRWRLAA